MNMTEDEWVRIKKHIASVPNRVHLDTNEEGTCVVIDGFGVLHPKAYLDLMEEKDAPFRLNTARLSSL